MIKIIAVQDKNEQNRLCGQCGAEFLPDALAYAGYICESADGKFACIAQFSLKSGYAELYNLSPAGDTALNEDAMLLCGRAALYFAYTHGVHEARCAMPVPEWLRLFRAIGFIPDDGGMRCDLKALFNGKCCGDK